MTFEIVFLGIDWEIWSALIGIVLVLIGLIISCCCCCRCCCRARRRRGVIRKAKDKQAELRRSNPNIFDEKKSELFNYVEMTNDSSSSSSSSSTKLSFDHVLKNTMRSKGGSGSAGMSSTVCMSTSSTSFYTISNPYTQQNAPFTDSLNCYLLHLSSHYISFQNNIAVPKTNAHPQEFFVFPLLKDIIRGIQGVYSKYSSSSSSADPAPVLDFLSPHSIVISPTYAVLLPVFSPRRGIANTAHRTFTAPSFLTILANYSATAVYAPGNTSTVGENGSGTVSINNAVIDEGFSYVVGGYETLRYCAPECLEGGVPTIPSLVYSICMILYSYVACQAPFGTMPIQDCVPQLVSGARPSLDALNGSPFTPFFTRCWSRQTQDRPSLDEMYAMLERMENEF